MRALLLLAFLCLFAVEGAAFCLLGVGDCPLKTGDSFKDCYGCPEMVVVPAGSFMMGSPPTDEYRTEYEEPQHLVTIARPFAVSKFASTFDEWDQCVAEGGCKGYKPRDEGWGRGRRPVINVSWKDAMEYVDWLSQKTRKAYRLLSEAEYEYAARAGTQTFYQWGDSLGKNHANCDACGSEWDNKRTAPVGSFAPNQFGLYDMAGNVLQWTSDCWHAGYGPQHANVPMPIDGSPWKDNSWDVDKDGPFSCLAGRVYRGGSWNTGILMSDHNTIRSAWRDATSQSHRDNSLGFRVGLTLDGP